MDPSDDTEPHDLPVGADVRPPTTSDDPVDPDAPTARPSLDLDGIERDLAGVEVALRRLEEGTYWTDEITGEPIPDDVLAADPVARRTA